MPITVVRVECDGVKGDKFCPWVCVLSGSLWEDDNHKHKYVNYGLVFPNYIFLNATDELDAYKKATAILKELGEHADNCG